MSATCTVPLWPEETSPVFIFRAMLLRREHFDARSTRASDDMAAVQYFGNGTDAFAHPRRAGFARNPPATPFDGNPTRFVFVFVPRATASDHFPPTRPRAAAKVYVATEAAIGLGLGLVAGAVWKVRLETRETRAPTRNRWPAAPRSPHPLMRRKNIARRRGTRFDIPNPRLTRLPAPPPQNWHWQTKREVEAFYAKGK